VTLAVGGSEYTFRGTISLFPADNLASQYIGGYKALNSTLRKCRQCLAVHEDMQSQVRVHVHVHLQVYTITCYSICHCGLRVVRVTVVFNKLSSICPCVHVSANPFGIHICNSFSPKLFKLGHVRHTARPLCYYLWPSPRFQFKFIAVLPSN